MVIIKIIAVIIFAISCIAIYHNTNSFEPKARIVYILIGMILMFGMTSIICGAKSNEIKVTNQEAIDDTLGVVKMFFTPINSLIFLAPLGNVIGKVKDEIISKDSACKILIAMFVIIIILLIAEINYIGGFIAYLLG